mmetsp:Transcript_19425/g.45944  ORF Transcript_19425/g.45944 Transcript_19425/m.45944 type:complete len:425 (+) Transcript_19425:132-1406(+)|eukprot:CAMPEP_0168758096 /NCGR_PEP_ID=MMETSP0724-20121128/21519_1 /TAXON_ID=265536 /ORGANISM="Amphiprora sp., Strain CCMP467" /LENGTH=424 /DNA_ID=CAMNT_0008806953 /DNA_START=78 /DNA_END=1352 /DNA_ORIENTATION=-
MSTSTNNDEGRSSTASSAAAAVASRATSASTSASTSQQDVRATSAFPSSSSSSSSATANLSSCSPCERLLRQVLEQSESRPHTLLANMTSTATTTNKPRLEWRATPNGIQVKIPTEESLPHIPLHRRRWTRIQPPPSEAQPQQQEASTTRKGKTTTSSLPFAQLFQATSSSFSALADEPPALTKTTAASNSSATSKPTTADRQPCAASTATSDTAATTTTTPNTTTEWMNVSCEVCPWTGPKGNARAFVNGPHPLDIVICSNRLRFQDGKLARQEMEEMMTHELVHVYDARQLQLDLRDCENLAYSEVRAAREAECRLLAQKYEEAQQQLQQQQSPSSTSSSYWPKLPSPSPSALLQNCVKERAFLATKNLFSYSDSRKCLNKVFDAAMADKRPFAAPPSAVPQQQHQQSSHTGEDINPSASQR